MRYHKKRHWVLAALVSAVMAGSAGAQRQIYSDGRLREANNRIGSGGSNQGYVAPAGITNGNFQYNNNLVTGNVTGGREFRGNVPYTNPTAFRGPTVGGISDQFIRGSSGPPINGIANNNAQTSQSFYGVSNAAPPPPGFVPQSPLTPGVGGFVPAAAVTRDPGDLRLGTSLNVPTAMLPAPGQLLLPGPVDPNSQMNTLITASPLYGMRIWNPNSETDRTFLNNNVGAGAMSNQRIDPATLQQLRSELIQQSPLDQTVQDQTQTDRGGTGQLNNSSLKPFESPANQSLTPNSSLKSSLNSNTALNPNLATGAGVQNRMMLQGPQQQSTQYAELQKRLQQYRAVQAQNEAQAGTDYNRQLLERNKLEEAKKSGLAAITPQRQAGQPGDGQAGGFQPGGLQPMLPLATTPQQSTTPELFPAPANNDKPAAPVVPAMPAQPGAPVQIRSLADGVQSASLSQLLRDGEAQMKSGRFNAALEQFEMAEQVAPNNPMINLGRAIAELGQSYYARADGHLREVFLQDQALLMGQYDLQSMLGAERLDFLARDLRALADREQKEPRALFLLAYIAYNTGNERRAAAYLDLAEKRAGPSDPLYPIIRKHWSLPKDAPADLNK